MLMINGAFRGIASGAAAGEGGGGSGADLLTLIAANNGIAGYKYWDIDATYIGAFGAPDWTAGDGWGYGSAHVIAKSNTAGRLFAIKRTDGPSDNLEFIAEYSIPTLYTGTTQASIPPATITQAAVDVLAGMAGTSEPPNRVSGMRVINGKLVANAYKFYDADTFITATTFVIDNPSAISTTDRRGIYHAKTPSDDYPGAQISGWISHVPAEWRAGLGGEWLFGFSYGDLRSIVTRHSVGPSAFIIPDATITAITGSSPPAAGADLAATPVMNFPYETPMVPIASATSAGQMWTMESEVYYAFIVPNTRTYLAVGYSGGHRATTSNPTIYYDNGYHCYDANNYDNWYWLFDVDDMVAVKNGTMLPHELRPYEYGPMTNGTGTDRRSDLPMADPMVAADGNFINGAMYDDEAEIFRISLARADKDGFSSAVINFDFSGLVA